MHAQEKAPAKGRVDLMCMMVREPERHPSSGHTNSDTTDRQKFRQNVLRGSGERQREMAVPSSTALSNFDDPAP
jgi:hypothetical protein